MINELDEKFLKFPSNREKIRRRIYDSLYNNHGNRQQRGHKIWLLAETYGYIAQFHPNQGAKKRNWFPPLLNWD